MSATARAHPPRLAPKPPRAPGPRIRERGGLLLRHPGCAAGYLEGKLLRRHYAAGLRAARADPVRDVDLEVSMWSFSSQRDLPEQVASISSFLRHAGRPMQWTVASDGSHDADARRLLEALHPSVTVRDWTTVADAGLPAAARRFADAHPLGKKFNVMASLPVDGPTMMVDSDVLFGPGSATLPADLETSGAVPRYQLDCYDVLHDALVADDERANPTNTGVVLFGAPIRWDAGFEALERILAAGGDVQGAWVEQAAAHLAMRANGAEPLDPDRFIIRDDDTLRYREARWGGDAVLRHYAGPTRYMMWCRIGHEALRRRVDPTRR